ncbi:hypothetical protein B0I35DRAFT_171114 [Stachybotrys elegans]|uniref:Uncharacterized protein n=1 Tax=Stachybotrys elegans TaxID=80388 RepID=A0A8K0T1G0_9HYPO|nr:hypothetical protein B0I35DRAFT_171114 [Stachybotrys elegans]
MMNKEAVTYRDFVHSEVQRSPRLARLLEHLEERPRNPSTIVSIEYPRGEQSAPKFRMVNESELANVIRDTSALHGRILCVENTHGPITSLVGEALDIDPVFFAGYIITDFEDIEKAPPPPSLALFPTEISRRGYLHFHYQQILDLGSSIALQHTPYNLKSCANISRNVRRLPPLSGRQLALGRTCCSMVLKRLHDTWTCLILIDPPITNIITNIELSTSQKAYPSRLLHGGLAGLLRPVSFSEFKSGTGAPQLDETSMLECLLHFFRASPPRFKANHPITLSLCYYPMRVVLGHWNYYTHLMSRYFKFYEYALHDIENRVHDSDITDLQRWRRRSMQSQHKLLLLTEFIHYWLQQERLDTSKQCWSLVLRDIKHLQSQLNHYNRSLERMIPVAASMVQLLDSRRSMVEAANISRLTFIALVFVPLSWVASLFSMSDGYSPGDKYFWVYFVTAMPTLLVVVFLSALRVDNFTALLRRTAARL